MKNSKECKSAFVVSVSHRKTEKIENPKPNSPKVKCEGHSYSILIIDNTKEMIDFLKKYTDFDEFTNSDLLAQKQHLKDYPMFSYNIVDENKFRNEILADNEKPSSWKRTVDFHWEYFQEHAISIRRLAIGIVKDPFNQKLYTY
ncbi:hypothetical protein [Tenacibaculum agarivorans]|uniref:hypothetical protein n=1 Tax=Tenacibaculum agarivorans TaxID=1908389 RepID=UPI000A8FF33B|nr:hypothetical protein [Tenacibaculum agarivorans]